VIIFDTNVTEEVGNEMCFIFPPHLTSATALPGEMKDKNGVHSLKCCK